MRTFALTLAVGAVVAQTTVAGGPSAVMVAPAGAMGVRAPVGAYGYGNAGMMSPYGGLRGGVRGGYGGYAARGVPAYAGARAATPYGYGYGAPRMAAPAYSPYAIRAPAPVAAPVAAPVVAAPVVEPTVQVAEVAVGPQYNHVDDYTNWRLAYLNAKAKKSEAVYNSPLLAEGWNWTGESPIDMTQAGTLRDQYQLQYYKQNMQAAEYALNVAAQNDAPLDELQEIKKWYDYENLRQMNQMVGGNPVMQYQIARQDYEWDGTSAAAALAAATTDAEKRNARLDLQATQMDLMDAMEPLLGDNAMSYPSTLKTMVGFMRESESLKGRQLSFDEAAVTYKTAPTAANMFEMQIDELKLEKSEARYMSKLAGIVSPLAALFNGNYKLSMKYKEEQMDAKIADLQEKLAAEQYKQNQSKEPYGRTSNLASEQKTQRAFYNLLTSGSGR